MSAQEIVGPTALLFQVAVAGYALWLNRSLKGSRLVWAPRLGLLLLLAVHLNQASQPPVSVSIFGLGPDWAYTFTALLIYLGLSHVWTAYREGRRICESSSPARVPADAEAEEQRGELVRANIQLAREVEQRQHAETKLRADCELYRGLVDSLDEIVFECRADDFAFTFVSAQSERLLGYTAEYWLEHLTWRDIIHAQDLGRVTESFRGIGSVPDGANEWLEYRVRTKDGAVRWVNQIAGLVPGKKGDDRIRGVLLDVTERKQLEDESRQQQKLEAIGRLASGVAHDFNNSLTVIQGYSQLLLSSANLVPETSDYIKQISQASDKAARLTQQLLAFGRKQDIKTEPLNINTFIEDAAKVLRAIVGEAVSVDLKLAAELPLVPADAGQLSQVLVNLVVNSRDAMPSGGRLVIQTEVVTFGQLSTNSDPEIRAGTFVCVSVSDSGIGIDPGVRPHVFEPFFTTKGAGKGTGLGLSTVYGVVKQHRGWVRVSSELNEGTTFRLFLPAAQGQGLVEPGKAEAASQQANHETILLVDDEPALLDLVKSILQSHGYEVLSARSGLAALKLWNDHAKKVDLLLTDVVMPDGLSGLDLLGHLREDRPQLPAILMSGYASPELSLSHRTAFIQKPYRPATLLSTIHDCLLGSAEPAPAMSHN